MSDTRLSPERLAEIRARVEAYRRDPAHAHGELVHYGGEDIPLLLDALDAELARSATLRDVLGYARQYTVFTDLREAIARHDVAAREGLLTATPEADVVGEAREALKQMTPEWLARFAFEATTLGLWEMAPRDKQDRLRKAADGSPTLRAARALLARLGGAS